MQAVHWVCQPDASGQGVHVVCQVQEAEASGCLDRERNLIADDDAYHRVTERTNVGMRTTTAFTVEATLTRSAHAEEFVSEVKSAEGPAGKSNGDQS